MLQQLPQLIQKGLFSPGVHLPEHRLAAAGSDGAEPEWPAVGLEKGDAQLGDSLQLFEEGTRLVSACRAELDQAEQQVVKLMKGADGAPVETEFASEE